MEPPEPPRPPEALKRLVLMLPFYSFLDKGALGGSRGSFSKEELFNSGLARASFVPVGGSKGVHTKTVPMVGVAVAGEAAELASASALCMENRT